MVKPRRLQRGDKIALVALASPFERRLFDAGTKELETLGFQPVYDERVFEKTRYLAGDPSNRALVFQEAWNDPEIAGIMAVRGGYGSSQVLPFLGQRELSKIPKVMIGCSDITSVLTFLSVSRGFVCFHGPMVTTLGRGAKFYDEATLLAQVMNPVSYGMIKFDELESFQGGSARGPLLGGTLTQLTASLATPFQFNPPEGYVLLLDDIGERPYRIDRMLTQLAQAGVLEKAAGVICAEFPDCDEPTGEVTTRTVLKELLRPVRGPVVYGLPTGHTVHPMLTLPLGINVIVDGSGAGQVVIDEAAVV